MERRAENTRRRPLSARVRTAVTLAIAVSIGFVAAVYAADPRLDEADAALQKAEALMLAAQSGPVAPKAEKEFDQHRDRAIDLINRAREQVAAAKATVDEAIEPTAGEVGATR